MFPEDEAVSIDYIALLQVMKMINNATDYCSGLGVKICAAIFDL